MWCLRREPFEVRVDLMAEPSLWRWEIRDPETNAVLASSWADDWMAYATSEEAFRAVDARLKPIFRATPRCSRAA